MPIKNVFPTAWAAEKSVWSSTVGTMISPWVLKGHEFQFMALFMSFSQRKTQVTKDDAHPFKLGNVWKKELVTVTSWNAGTK
jgi:hypothetical protein